MEAPDLLEAVRLRAVEAVDGLRLGALPEPVVDVEGVRRVVEMELL